MINKKINKSLIYFFEIGMGGIGDYIKFFIVAYDFCINNNLNFFYVNKHPIENYIIFKNIENKINEYDTDETLNIDNINILTCDFIKNNNNRNFFLLKPQSMYNCDAYEICNKYLLKDLFYFSNDIIDYYEKNINLKNYTSIHLRLGDAYLETDKNFVQCPYDKRYYDENNMLNFLTNNINNNNMYFFCDNETFKNKIKNKFSNINILDLQIGHTSLINTTNEQIFNTVIEFYIMANSETIYMFSLSGFPIMSSRFNGVKLIKY